MQRLRDRVEDYLDYRAPVWALVLVGVALFVMAVALLFLLPQPPVLQLAGIFALSIMGSWFLRTGIQVHRKRKEDALAAHEAASAQLTGEAHPTQEPSQTRTID